MDRHSGRVSGALKGVLFRHRWRGAAWALLALVTIASLAPLPAMPGAPSGSDKLVHFAMYAALMYCYARAYPWGRWYIAAAGLIGYGIGMEIFQYFLPPRSASMADALANSAGVLIMLRTLIGWRHRSPGRHDPMA